MYTYFQQPRSVRPRSKRNTFFVVEGDHPYTHWPTLLSTAITTSYPLPESGARLEIYNRTAYTEFHQTTRAV